MVLQKNINNTEYLTKLKKAKEAFKIKCNLKLAGYSQKMVADELGISKQAVCMVINGNTRSKRVEKWLKENLGV